MTRCREGLDIRLLGPVRADADGGPLDLGPRKQRLVFAVLALEVNRPVPVDRLVELAWPIEAPRTAAHAVRVCVSGLRSALSGRPDATIDTRGAGYALHADPEHVDASRFRGLLKRAAAAGNDASRVALLNEALALWSGPAVFGMALSGTAPPETQELLCRGLEESRLTAIEDRFDAVLRLGDHRVVLGEVTELARVHPTRERLAGQLMLCLYRDGRRTEALDSYQRLRERLGTEFGVDPGPAVRDLQLAILRDDPSLRPASLPAPAQTKHGRAAAQVPAQLPPAVGDFVGRTAEFTRLDALVDGGPATTVVVSGMAGVGKTALAVQWGHRMRADFPDGQLYINLNGYAPEPPLAPPRVLAGFLTALGVPAKRIPADQEEATSLYRTLLADRRVLVILDNAARPEQVRPLMPGGPQCRVLVTSRSRLGGLVARDGARELALGVLTPDEGVNLLARLAGVERSVLPVLAQMCAYLPLALRIAAAQLVRHSDGPHRYLAQLDDANRLAALEIDDDQEAAVRAAFDLSYATLDGLVRRLFRLLGLVPGADISVAAAAALAGVAPDSVEPVLDALADAHLVERLDPGRYALHDLLRLYAAERADRDEDAAVREAAIRRLDTFYLHATDRAARLLYPTTVRLPLVADQPAPTLPPSFTDHRTASAWLDAERGNLVAVAVAATRAGRHAAAYSLGDALAGYFWMRRYSADWLIIARTALTSAVAADDPRAQAASHRHLSGVHQCRGHGHDAITELDRALVLAKRAGWREGQATMVNGRALAAQDLGDTERAQADFVEALALYRAAGLRAGEPMVLSNLGGLYGRIGRLDDAVDAFRQALAVDRELGATSDVAIDLSNLGGAYWRLGRLDEALRHLSDGLDLHREVGNRAGEVNTLNYLVYVHCDAGRDEVAATVADADLAKAQDLGDPRIEIDAWNAVATTRSRLDAHDESAQARRRALELAVATGYLYGTAEALIGLSASTTAVHTYVDSLEHAGRALDAAQRAGFLVLEGHARAALAAAHLGAGDVGAALVEAQRAETIYHDAGCRLGRARALRLLGTAVLDRSPALAEARWRQSLTLFSEIGTPEADEVQRLLTSWCAVADGPV